jgi:hypothetical protein
MSKVQVKKQLIAKPTIKKPLTKVSFENGFHFYSSIGNYSGITVTNLNEFVSKLKIVPVESVKFHFHRKDFENWIKYTIKDGQLAEKISRTKAEQPAEDLRKEILKTIETSISSVL